MSFHSGGISRLRERLLTIRRFTFLLCAKPLFIRWSGARTVRFRFGFCFSPPYTSLLLACLIDGLFYRFDKQQVDRVLEKQTQFYDLIWYKHKHIHFCVNRPPFEALNKQPLAFKNKLAYFIDRRRHWQISLKMLVFTWKQ